MSLSNARGELITSTMLQPHYAILCRSRTLLLVSLPFWVALAGCGADSTDGGGAGTGGATAGGGAGQSAGTSGTGGTSAGQSAAGTGAGGTAAGSTAGQAGGAIAGSGNPGSALHGYFDVALNPASAETGAGPSTSVIGKLYDGAYPAPNAWKLEAEADGCKLSTPEPLFCQPMCSGGVCVAENTCEMYPRPVTVGTVTVTGVGTTPFDMNPIVNNYQPPAGTNISFPPCAPGAEVKLAAQGGNGYPAFMLTAACVPAIEAAAEVEIEAGQPLMLSWNAPADPSKSRMKIELDISHHGGTKGKIECDVPDTGTLAIPAAQVDKLVELGVSGFPTVLLTRLSKNATGTGVTANVALNVSASFRQAVKVPGLTSCASNDDECPEGQTCQDDLKCQ